MAKGRLKVKVEGLAELAEIPGWLETGQKRFLQKAANGIAEKIAETAPGGKGRSIGRATRANTLSPTKAEVVVDHPGARVLERGGFIQPRGRALKFQAGGRTVFSRRGVRIAPRGFAKKGLRSRHKIVRAAYAEAMGDVSKGR